MTILLEEKEKEEEYQELASNSQFNIVYESCRKIRLFQLYSFMYYVQYAISLNIIENSNIIQKG